MQVEINEVVSTIRVVEGSGPAMSARQLQALIETVLRAVDERQTRDGRRAAATGIPDDGRGGVDRQGWEIGQ